MDEGEKVRGWHSAYSLHHDLGNGICEECSNYTFTGFVNWPCKTILALEGKLDGTSGNTSRG